MANQSNDGKLVITPEEFWKQIYAIVIGEMRNGAPVDEIAHKLMEELGIEFQDAQEIANRVSGEVVKLVAEQTPNKDDAIRGMVGGLLAALFGGIAWGLLVLILGLELGIVAWLMGYLCGMAALGFSGGKRGPLMQLIAVATSLAGIMFGKYLSFFFVLNKLAKEQLGHGISMSIMLTHKFFGYFVESIDLFDAFWILIASYTAFRITGGAGIDLSKYRIQGTKLWVPEGASNER